MYNLSKIRSQLINFISDLITQTRKLTTSNKTIGVGDTNNSQYDLNLVLHKLTSVASELDQLKKATYKDSSFNDEKYGRIQGPNEPSIDKSLNEFPQPQSISNKRTLHGQQCITSTMTSLSKDNNSSTASKKNKSKASTPLPKQIRKSQVNDKSNNKINFVDKENGNINETRRSNRKRNNLNYFKTHNGFLMDE